MKARSDLNRSTTAVTKANDSISTKNQNSSSSKLPEVSYNCLDAIE